MSDEFYQTVADKFIFKVKKGLLYTEDDIWVNVKGETFRIGVTDFFQRRGGDVVYLELPKANDNVKRQEEVVKFETIKAVSTIKSPLDGTVIEVNTLLSDKPELINEDPYGKGWLILISPSNLKDNIGRLLSAEKYFEFMNSKIKDDLKKTGKA
ncbi:MAG: glycine cleavage system protein GcvH [Candidatus Bathyarchaeota archaeon]